jgi:hypothetical protein
LLFCVLWSFTSGSKLQQCEGSKSACSNKQASQSYAWRNLAALDGMHKYLFEMDDVFLKGGKKMVHKIF